MINYISSDTKYFIKLKIERIRKAEEELEQYLKANVKPGDRFMCKKGGYWEAEVIEVRSSGVRIRNGERTNSDALLANIKKGGEE